MMKKWICLLLMTAYVCSAAAQYKKYRGDGPDDALRLLPMASAVVLKACNVESRDGWKPFLVNAGLSAVMSAGVTYGLKHAVHDTRPDGTDRRAFPSGHASVAFCGAHVLYKEFRSTSIWIPVAGYAVATATAIDRVRRHRHEWDDVLAGAAIGIACTEAGYWVGEKLLPNHEKYALSIAPTGISLHVSL